VSALSGIFENFARKPRRSARRRWQGTGLSQGRLGTVAYQSLNTSTVGQRDLFASGSTNAGNDAMRVAIVNVPRVKSSSYLGKIPAWRSRGSSGSARPHVTGRRAPTR